MEGLEGEDDRPTTTSRLLETGGGGGESGKDGEGEGEREREKRCHDNVKSKSSPHIPQDFNLPKFAASSKAFILYQ